MTAVLTSFSPTEVGSCFHQGRSVRHRDYIVRKVYFSSSVVYIEERTRSVSCKCVIFCFQTSNTVFSITREALIQHEAIIFVACYIGVCKSYGIFTFYDANFTVIRYAVDIVYHNITRRVDNRTAFARCRKFCRFCGDSAFSAICSKCSRVSPFSSDSQVFAIYSTFVSSI